MSSNRSDNRYITRFESRRQAMEWCYHIAKQFLPTQRKSHGKYCIVLDIDWTIVTDTGKPIREVIDFARYATNVLGYPLYLVTARPGFPENRSWTVKQLAANGFVERGRGGSSGSGRASHPGGPMYMLLNNVIHYEKLFMLPMSEYERVRYSGVGFSKYKFACRTRAINHRVLINIGDQWDDLLLRDPPIVHDRPLHSKLYTYEHASLRFNPDATIVGVNVSPCSMISVKLSVPPG